MLDTWLGLSTLFAWKLRYVAASKHILDQELLRRTLKLSLHPVKKYSKELLRVLLNGNVGRIAIEILESKDEISWVNCLSLGTFQKAEKSLQLNQQIIIDLPVLPLLYVWIFVIFRFQQQVSELRHHKELLKHADHVANTAKIDNPWILVASFVWGLMRPFCWSW